MKKQIHFPDSDLEVSRLALGTMNYPPYGEADRLIAAYMAAGGNFIDTAHCYAFWKEYGAGGSELAVASYFRKNGGREKVIIATKGGHPSASSYRKTDSYMSPYRIRADIDDSLSRLDSDRVDLFWLHRDDESVPVNEIMDYLSEEIGRGRIRYPAASNWSTARIQEANDYARNTGKQPFVASQPQFSLAPLVRENGGLRSLGRESELKWHRDTQFPVVGYSPVAQGYFATGGQKGASFDSPENRKRLERVAEAAKKHGATPNQIVLAWLVNQPFPVIPIIGTMDPDHLAEALGSLDVALNGEEVEWLATGRRKSG